MRSLLLLLALAAPALAQQPSIELMAPPSANVQAISDEMVRQLQSSIEARTALIETQRRLVAAEARIKVLEDKYEPKPTANSGVQNAQPATR